MNCCCCFLLLLLLTLTPCDCDDVTQISYQAEENQNITLEWNFTTYGRTSSEPLIVCCELLTDEKSLVLYHLREGVELSGSQNYQFSGRVQCDRDSLREGRVRLHVSRLRTEDSGRYRCKVNINSQWVVRENHLNVTAAAAQPERTTETPGPESRRRIALYFALGAVGGAAVSVAALVLLVKLVKRRCS